MYMYEFAMKLACSTDIFWMHGCTFSYYATILDEVTVEGWGKRKFAEGLEVRWSALLPTSSSNPLPVKHLIAIQDGGIKILVYRVCALSRNKK